MTTEESVDAIDRETVAEVADALNAGGDSVDMGVAPGPAWFDEQAAKLREALQ